MIKAEEFVSSCKEFGFDHFTGTPCSYLKPFINYVIDDDSLKFFPSVNEGEAVAMASGFWLGGVNGVVMFQNSGLGNAFNPISSLSYTFKIPFLGIVTLRGEPDGAPDEPQHELMGEITTKTLDVLGVEWEYFPDQVEEIVPCLNRAKERIDKREPYFLVMKKGTIEAYDLKKNVKTETFSLSEITASTRTEELPTRTMALKEIVSAYGDDHLIIATTGKTGRELYELGDKNNQMYMVGSMGCALSIGIGLALVRPDKKVCIIDGDGALMMRMGSMVLPAQLGLKNIKHILLDNEVHDSTGGQFSGSKQVGFTQIALGSGYQSIAEVNGLGEFKNALSIADKGPSFIHCKIKPGSPKDLGRPKVTPEFVAKRFKESIY